MSELLEVEIELLELEELELADTLEELSSSREEAGPAPPDGADDDELALELTLEEAEGFILPKIGWPGMNFRGVSSTQLIRVLPKSSVFAHESIFSQISRLRVG